MSVPRTVSIALLLAAIAPIASLLVIIGSRFAQHEDLAVSLVPLFLGSLPLYFVVMLVFLYLNFKSTDSAEEKLLWSLGLFMFFPLVGPPFWYMRVWRRGNLPKP